MATLIIRVVLCVKRVRVGEERKDVSSFQRMITFSATTAERV